METLDPAHSVGFDLLQIIGTVAFAVSGAVAAMRAEMDLVGVALLSTLVAVGGGSLRDVALGDLPMWWIDDWWAVLLAIVVGLGLVPLRHRFSANRAPDSWRVVIIADALGLAAFTVIGASLALSLGFADWVAVVMGIVTGVGGGVMRDVLVDTKPQVLVGQVYATAALAGALLFVGLHATGLWLPLVYWLPATLVVAVRLVAIRRRWEFPPLQFGARPVR